MGVWNKSMYAWAWVIEREYDTVLYGYVWLCGGCHEFQGWCMLFGEAWIDMLTYEGESVWWKWSYLPTTAQQSLERAIERFVSRLSCLLFVVHCLTWEK